MLPSSGRWLGVRTVSSEAPFFAVRRSVPHDLGDALVGEVQHLGNMLHREAIAVRRSDRFVSFQSHFLGLLVQVGLPIGVHRREGLKRGERFWCFPQRSLNRRTVKGFSANGFAETDLMGFWGLTGVK